MNLEELNLEQGSAEWHAARAGWVTCSKLSAVMAKGEGRTRLKYMRQLAAEKLLGRSAESFTGNVYTKMGKDLEPANRALLEDQLGVKITETGIIRNHDFRLSCSPDGLLGDEEMAEFKTCIPTEQIERLERDRLPPEHLYQVQGSLLATGRKACWYQSYSPGLPRLVLRVEPDLKLHDLILSELSLFHAELDELVSTIRGKY